MKTLPYQIIRLIILLLAAIPRQVITQLAKPLGRVWFAVDRRHRSIAINNLTIAFGTRMSAEDIRDLAKANFVQLARLVLEIPSLFKLKRTNLDRYVTFTGGHHLVEALQSGNGVLILTAHMGNWELMALAFALKFGRPCNALARPLDYEPADRLLTELRRTTGNRVVDKANAGKAVAAMLKNDEIVGILLDQTASWYEGVFVPFFGKIACTNKGMAMFAQRYKAPVLPAFNYRLPDGRYRIVIDRPLPIVTTGNTRYDIMINTERFNRVIEKHILSAPDNWFWVHRRWRIISVPDNQKKRFEENLAYYGASIDDHHEF